MITDVMISAAYFTEVLNSSDRDVQTTYAISINSIHSTFKINSIHSTFKINSRIIDWIKEEGFNYPLTEEQEVEFKLKYM